MDLKKEREKKNLTQQDIANLLGISVNAYRNIENGTSVPKPHRLEKLDKLLPGSMQYLLERKKGKEDSDERN